MFRRFCTHCDYVGQSPCGPKVGRMNGIREIAFLALLTMCSTSIAHEVTMKRAEVDQTLAAIAPHAEQLPLHFASRQERLEIQGKLLKLLYFLDAALRENPDETELLLRDAIGNGFGHNMGCPDCGDKAIRAYEPSPSFDSMRWRIPKTRKRRGC
jgi:hypothetical protein